MKKIFLISLTLLFASMVYAQTGQEIKPSELPKATKDYVNKVFPGCTITKAAKIDDPKKELTYITIVSDGSKHYVLGYNEKGDFVKKIDKATIDAYKLKQASSKPATSPDGKATKSTTAQPAGSVQSAPKK